MKDIDFIILMEQLINTHNKLSGLKKLRPYRLPTASIAPAMVRTKTGIVAGYELTDTRDGSEPTVKPYAEGWELRAHMDTRISLMRSLVEDLRPGRRKGAAA